MDDSEDQQPMAKVKSDRANEKMYKTNTSRINDNIEHNQWKDPKSSQNQEQMESLVITTTKEGVDKQALHLKELKITTSK